VARAGGSIIFVFHFSRLVLVLSLLVLSIFSFLQEEGLRAANSGPGTLNKHWGKWRKPKHRNGGGGGGSLSKREWLDLAACLNYVCLFATLSVPSLISPSLTWNSYLLPSWPSFPSRLGGPTPRWPHSTSPRYC
jgi:hypothetical protein